MLEIVNCILRRTDLTINMTESLLRLQANIPDFEGFEHFLNLFLIKGNYYLNSILIKYLEQKCKRPEEPFQDLNRKTSSLKKILSRIPDEINDRKTFLETIK